MSDIRRAITDATAPYTLAQAVRPILKGTPEYEQAYREKRSRRWLEAEALSLGYALAEVVQQRLDNLDPDAGR
jgi:hypothetical protein